MDKIGSIMEDFDPDVNLSGIDFINYHHSSTHPSIHPGVCVVVYGLLLFLGYLLHWIASFGCTDFSVVLVRIVVVISLRYVKFGLYLLSSFYTRYFKSIIF